MDISDTLAPKSDQLDGIDLIDGPQTFTVERVSRGNAEQPVQIHLVEFPRVWRPGKNMRRVLAYCWGKDASTWVNKRVTLYYDPNVTFGKDKPGGTRISHLSDIDGPKLAPIIITKGKSGTWPVQPLTSSPSTPAVDPETERAIADLTAEWHDADPERKEAIKAEVAKLRGGAA